MASDSTDLGSLSQSARSKKLRSARGILLFVGILTVVVNGFFYMGAEKEIDMVVEQEMQRLRGQGLVFDQDAEAQFKREVLVMVQLIYGGAAALGVVFIGLGVVVKKFPVGATLLGLVLYVGAIAIFGLMDKTTLYQGLIFRIIIIVALVQSLRAAIAYQKEQAAATTAEPLQPVPQFGEESL